MHIPVYDKKHKTKPDKLDFLQKRRKLAEICSRNQSLVKPKTEAKLKHMTTTKKAEHRLK